ncbi:MAG TPA: hypothetical protein VNG91_00840 [Terriglobia bacterium]|nr:hypothetical protein [Terriglobia bacterium]
MLEERKGSAAATARSGNNASLSTAGQTAPWRATWQAGQSGAGAGVPWCLVQAVLTVAVSLKKVGPSTWWCSSSTRKMCNCTTTAIQAVRKRAEWRPRKTEDFLEPG